MNWENPKTWSVCGVRTKYTTRNKSVDPNRQVSSKKTTQAIHLMYEILLQEILSFQRQRITWLQKLVMSFAVENLDGIPDYFSVAKKRIFREYRKIQKYFFWIILDLTLEKKE